ncbi:MAG: polyhydroxyalkanoic acid system family protein [Thermodesulfobacteriota bacterium]
MAHILITRRHSISLDKLLAKLKPAVEESAAKFDLEVQWAGSTCKFTGMALGYLKVGETSLTLAARLSYAALLHKRMIEKEISQTLDAVLG